MMANSNGQIDVPVLLITFNRPDTTQQVFEKIREARPAKLFVAVDGPRENNPTDNEKIKKVREIVQKVDWSCDPFFHFNEKNAGAEATVSSAISWVFETQEYAIILEDDIVAPLSFFRFAEEMLIKYADNPQIGTVTGSNFTPIPVPGDTDYFFAKYGHSGGGWATWKRAWQEFDLNVEIPEAHLQASFLKKITNSRSEMKFFQKVFTNMKKKGAGNSTWDNIGRYYHRVNERLSIIPKVNLTTNIGIYGLHTRGETEHHFRPYDENFVIKKHPKEVFCFHEYDKHHFKTYINLKRPLYKRVFKKLRSTFYSHKSVN
jgi:hypothetical protein